MMFFTIDRTAVMLREGRKPVAARREHIERPGTEPAWRLAPPQARPAVAARPAAALMQLIVR